MPGHAAWLPLALTLLDRPFHGPIRYHILLPCPGPHPPRKSPLTPSTCENARENGATITPIAVLTYQQHTGIDCRLIGDTATRLPPLPKPHRRASHQLLPATFNTTVDVTRYSYTFVMRTVTVAYPGFYAFPRTLPLPLLLRLDDPATLDHYAPDCRHGQCWFTQRDVVRTTVAILGSGSLTCGRRSIGR